MTAQTIRQPRTYVARTTRPDGPATRVGFRADIEGLRAVAVTLVVLYHAGFRKVSGGYVGVDVFFVISGFLITRLLVGELAASGTISVAGFYARRSARLLPAATLVIAATLVASRYWLPLRTGSIARDAIASTYYGLNVRLAHQRTDYLSAAGPRSPLQHFWSLAVEEQFYLAWPLALLAVALAVPAWQRLRHRPQPLRPERLGPTAAVAVLFAFAVASFGVNLWLTRHDATSAFFATPARAWEVATGAVLVFCAPAALRLPRTATAMATWTGLAAVLASAVVFDETTAFPGFPALLPVAGAALVIFGGCAAPARGVSILLGRSPFQRVGELSYGWYLWHWPVLVIAPTVLGHGPSRWQTAVLIAASLLLATGSHLLLENPVRRAASLKRRPWKALTLAAALSTVVALLATALPYTLVGPGRPAGTTNLVLPSADPAPPLTQLIDASLGTPAVPSNLTPTLLGAASDQLVIDKDGCVTTIGSEVTKACEYGDTTSATSIVLFGDSHAAHWFPALNQVAKARSWKLLVFTMGSCSAASTLIVLDVFKRPYTECARWRERSVERIRALRPAVLVMSSTDSYPAPIGAAGDPDQAWADGWATTFQALRTGPTKLVLIRDTPRLKPDAIECLARHLKDSHPCDRRLAEAVVEPRRRHLVAEAAARDGVTVVDPVPWLCTNSRCPAIVGNILVYRDGSHLSTPYSTLLAPLLAQRLGR